MKRYPTKIAKITGTSSDKTPPTGGGVQLFRSWSHLEMASVLSGWYAGYHHHNAAAAASYHNLFNIANFIEYEPYPKRRKLDHKTAAAAAAVAYGRYHHQGNVAAEGGAADFELSHKEVSRANSSLYRPYTHDSLNSNGVNGGKKSSKYLQDNVPGGKGGHGAGHGHHGHDRLMLGHEELDQECGHEDELAAQVQDQGKYTMENLFPEILSLIFNKLDIQSLGRAAQVLT